MITLGAFLLAVLLLVTLHEWGHFIVARFFKVPVERFSIGFGKPLLCWTDRLGTQYLVGILPLGGYVKMQDTAFVHSAPSKRIAIMVAGPLVNILFAWCVYSVFWLSGTHSPLGIFEPSTQAEAVVQGALIPEQAAVRVNKIIPGSPAEKAQLAVGDELLALDQQPFTTVKAFIEYLGAHPHHTVLLQYQRKGQLHTVPIALEKKEVGGAEKGFLGVELYQETMVHVPLWARPSLALKLAGLQMVEDITMTATGISHIFYKEKAWQQLGGPVSIARAAGGSLELGWIAYLHFLAIMSISLAFINALPIPGLDGGQVAFTLVELLFGRPLPPRVQTIGLQLGFMIILIFMSIAFFNDFNL